jgi:alkane 1-monooxygenase
MKDLKYLLAYLPISSVYIGFYQGGMGYYAGFLVAFVAVPILEFFFTGNRDNRTDLDQLSPLKLRFFDVLLYLNMPLVYILVWYSGRILYTETLTTLEIAGVVSSLGIILSTCGINVGHELGHRSTKYEQFFSKILLLPNLYLHFFIEHNLGHHKNVATKEDPATSRLGENVYAFFWRSVTQSYLDAWKIEHKRLRRSGQKIWSFQNQMIRFQIIQLIYLTVLVFFFNVQVMLLLALAGVIGFLLLELVNYIEHYGLQRKRLPSGRYEPVQPKHSWNSNHDLGRILLYELTRHSDHHFKSTRKYQTLRHFDEAPQLPYGYPMSMLMALVPPIWFRMMNKLLENKNDSNYVNS